MWSVTWQAAVGREFFVAPSLYARVRDRLIAAHRRPGRVLLDFLLLPAEIHVLSQLPPGDSARGVAREVGSLVSRWVKEIQPVRSPVMAGPYCSLEIPSIDDLRSEVRMLAWRPVFLGMCATPTHYPHGTLRIALGLASIQGFEPRPLLDLFGVNTSQAREALRRWIARRPSDNDLLVWEFTRGLVLVAGAITSASGHARTVRNDAALLLVAGGTKSLAGALRLLDVWVTARLASSDDTPSGPLKVRSAQVRALVACLAVQHRLCSASEAARRFGRAKSTLSEQMSSCRRRPEFAEVLATPVPQIIAEGAALTTADPMPKNRR
jgi:hypothetical protein